MSLEINLEKYKIPEESYLKHVAEILAGIPADGKFVIIGLCAKIRGYADTTGECPVFLYEAGDPDGNAIVLEWAASIDKQHLLLPKLLVHYLVATVTEEQLDEILESPEAAIEDLALLVVILKYQRAIAEQRAVRQCETDTT